MKTCQRIERSNLILIIASRKTDNGLEESLQKKENKTVKSVSRKIAFLFIFSIPRNCFEVN